MDQQYTERLVPFSARHPRMPELYEAVGHPKHPASNPGRSFVFNTLITHPSMQEWSQAGHSIKVPYSMNDEQLAATGWLQLIDGDYLWARNINGSGSPEDDVLVLWVVGSQIHSRLTRECLDRAMDGFLGPQDELTPDSVLFERLKPRPTPVGNSTRCYTLGPSLEPNTDIEAPCANSKWRGELVDYHKLTTPLLKASTTLAMRSMEEAPPEVQEVLRQEFDRLGTGSIGCDGNYAFNTVQCNIAYAGEQSLARRLYGTKSLIQTSVQGTAMTEQMGRFAHAHKDGKDSGARYSNLMRVSQLPDNYDPGRIFLSGLGVYTRLEQYRSLNFQGQRDHVGSPPTPLPGTSASPTAYRVILVHYPPSRTASGVTRQRIASTPAGHIYLAPEMRLTGFDQSVHLNDSYATFFRDGHSMMTRKSYSSYVARSAYLLMRYVLMQTFPGYEIDADPDDLLDCITYLAEDGTRQKVDKWALAPSIRDTAGRGRTELRTKQEAAFKEHYFKHGSHIPECYLHNSWIREEASRRFGPGPSTVDGGDGGAQGE
ncbi:hypothetical protein MD484_g2073, partial [Candolleomyces efflorescens]